MAGHDAVDEEGHHRQRDQGHSDDRAAGGYGAAEEGPGAALSPCTLRHALWAMETDRCTAHAVRADGTAATGAADVRLAVRVPVAGGYD